MTIVCVSGGFDPFHTGHLDYIEGAQRIEGSSQVHVILNSDDWLMRKKGYVFMPFEERARLLRGLKVVSLVWSVDDSDGSVCEALRRIKPDYFVNGGDRQENNTPEKYVCEELNIKMVFNVGGGKTNSSQEIVSRAISKA